jgi:hypothetical protein
MPLSRDQRLAGEFLIDHSASPGLSESQAFALGIPLAKRATLFEGKFYTCGHCQAMVHRLSKDPGQPTSDPAYCNGCSHYICDDCAKAKAAGAACRPFAQLVDEVLEAAHREASGLQSSVILLP